MTMGEEIITRARELSGLDEVVIENLLEACEALYMHGTADRVGGDVESHTGHYYLIERWLVTTDSGGNTDLHEFPSLEAAEFQFDCLEEKSKDWDGGL